jgi:protoheme IX farnesyltransferase
VIQTPAAQTQSVVSPLAYARDLALLAKPRLSGLVVCTAAGGMWLAPGQLTAPRAFGLLAGTILVVGAANVLNCYLERDVDALMRRTRDRPLPAGRVDPRTALALGLGVAAFSISLLALATNALTALLAAIALVTYVLVYTPMKQRSGLALFVGAVPGAIPPLMGWTGVTGRLDLGGLALFGILFFWQLPHFLAISLYLAEDYARGGIKVFALVHGERATKLWAALTSIALVPVTLSCVPLGIAGPFYGAAASLLGLGLSAYAISGLWQPGRGLRWARSFFLVTLAYLTLLFIALFVGAR